jgi:eukaryotic-like serine/threonine-protein kinase
VPSAHAPPDDRVHLGTYFLGRYRVVDEIGVGGMASVHLARMDGAGGFQKWVAIKKIHPHLVQDEHFINMFLDEARIAAKISHPNVAQVFELGSHENTYWLAMEYLQGEPLREVMRRNEETHDAIEPALAAYMMADAAEGLHAAHELRGKRGEPLNLVHRDVSPHNLFLTFDGMVKVVDFGIAKVAGRLSRTRAGTLKGKLAYMSPEQVRGEEVDRRTDIFALGVVLWEISTGSRLFRMDTEIDTLEKVRLCIVPSPSSLRPDFPAELESIVMRALAKHPDRRFQSARDMSRALRQYLVRSGRFIGREEVTAYANRMFRDRIQKRQEHLKWAAEVTGTISTHAANPPDSDENPWGEDDEDTATIENQLVSTVSTLSETLPDPSLNAAPEPQAAGPLRDALEVDVDAEDEETETKRVSMPPAPQPGGQGRPMLDPDAVVQQLPPKPAQLSPRVSPADETLKLRSSNEFPLFVYAVAAIVTFVVVVVIAALVMTR